MKNSDKPDLPKLAELCGRVIVGKIPDLSGSGDIYPIVEDIMATDERIVFNPFMRGRDGPRSREVLREAVIAKAKEQDLIVEVNYQYGVVYLMKINFIEGFAFYKAKPEAFAWAEALAWLGEQEKGD